MAAKSGWGSSTSSTPIRRTQGQGPSGWERSFTKPCGRNALARPAEPLRDDRLVAGLDRRAVVQRVVVRRAVALQIVPEHRRAGLRRDLEADVDEPGLAPS